MMKGSGTRYSTEFRDKVVADAQEVLSEAGSDDPPRGWMARLCREHGITSNTLGQWMRRTGNGNGKGGAEALPPAEIAPVAVVRRPYTKRAKSLPVPAEPSRATASRLAQPEQLIALPGETHGKIQVVFVSVEGNAQTLQEALKQVATLKG